MFIIRILFFFSVVVVLSLVFFVYDFFVICGICGSRIDIVKMKCYLYKKNYFTSYIYKVNWEKYIMVHNLLTHFVEKKFNLYNECCCFVSRIFESNGVLFLVLNSLKIHVLACVFLLFHSCYCCTFAPALAYKSSFYINERKIFNYPTLNDELKFIST